MAQLALNTLKTPVVVPEDNTLHITGGSGDTNINITGGSVTYKVTASNDAYARAISSVEGSDQTTVNGIQGYVIELGEKLYDGKLQLRENARDGEVYDDFGRPARRWQYDGKTFGTYTKVEELRQEYTKKVTGKMLYDELGSDIVRSIENNGQWDLNVTIDGETSKTVLDTVDTKAYFSIASVKRTNTDAVGRTGNGVLTQVYVDSVNHEVNIAIINTYLAIADQDYNERDDDVDLTVYKIGGSQAVSNTYYVKLPSDVKDDMTIAAKGDKLDIVDVKEDDKYLVTIAQGEIQSMVKPEIVSETTLNSFKKTDWVKNDDAQYDYASTAQYDEDVLDEYDAVNMKDVTYNVILDKYGYLVGLELNEGVAQYAFLTGIDLGSSNLSVKNATGNLIFLDGTMKTVTINVEKSEFATFPKVNDVYKTYTTTGGGADLSSMSEAGIDPNLYVVPNDNGTPTTRYGQMNTWCTYTEDGNGVYTLKQVGSSATARKDDPNPVKGAKKAAQSYIDVDSSVLTTTYVKTAGELPINNKNTSLMGSGHTIAIKPQALKDGAATSVTGDFNYVYGNNDTVYINAKLKAVTPKNGSGKLAIVDKVDSAVTGIANVDFTVKNIDKSGDLTGSDVPKAEVYALYNDNGYLIGVVTLNAEDNGTSSHFAYITKEVSQEDYMGGNTWRWHVDAIVDGKKVQLTEANDTMDYLRNMKPGEWYSVTYDKDGNVNGIKSEGTWSAPAKNKPLNFNFATDDKFVTSVESIRPATNGFVGGGYTGTTSNSTVLLYRDYRCNVQNIDGVASNDHNNSNTDKRTGELKVEGDTLYTSRNQSEGIRISPDTKTVLILSKGHNTDAFDSVTDGYEGASGLDKALKTLKTDTVGGYTTFDGVLTVVLKDGVATSIILEDESGNGRSGIVEQGKPMQVTLNFMHNTTRDVIDTVTYTIYANASYVPNTILTQRGLDSAYEAVNNNAINITYVEGGSPVTRTVLIKDKVGGGDTTAKRTIRVEYYHTSAIVEGNFLGYENVEIAVDAVGYNKAPFTADMCTKVPEGYELAAGVTGATALPVNTIAPSTSVIKIGVQEKTVKSVKAIATPAARAGGTATLPAVDVKYSGSQVTDCAAAVTAAGISFEITYQDDTKRVVAAEKLAFAVTPDQATGDITATYGTGGAAKTCTVAYAVYADLGAKAAWSVGADLSTDWEVKSVALAEADNKVQIGDVITVVVVKKVAGDFDAAAFEALGSTVTAGDATDSSFTVDTAAGKAIKAKLTKEGADAVADPATAAVPAEITFTFTVKTIGNATVGGAVNIAT